MSAIDLKLKKLKEQEEKLKLEQLKIDFLKHIEDSVINYRASKYDAVKVEVIELVKKFVADTIGSIEGLEVKVERTGPKTIEVTATQTPKAAEPAKPQSAEPVMSMNEKKNFALDNRHLAGKRVMVANDKSVEINGEVVGLDAPFVLVKVDSGPTIKVPLGNVSLK